MKYTKIIKRETKVMIGIVAILLMLVLGASYALFLKVSSSHDNQVVKTGTLEVAYESTNGYINGNTYPDITPMTDEDGIDHAGYSFTVENTGDLKTAYKVYIYIDQSGFDYYKEHTNSNAELFTDLNNLRYNFRTSSSDTNTNVATIGSKPKITENGIDKYELYSGTVEGTNSTNEHVVRVWLSPSMSTSDIGKYVYLKLEVQSEVDTTPEPTAWQPTYYAFGDVTTSSTTDYTTLNKNVFVGLDTAGNKGVCINRSGTVSCFQANNVAYEQTHIQQVFNEPGQCSYDSGNAYWRCYADDFDCDVDDDGYVNCYDYGTDESCKVRPNGSVDCS